MNKKPKYVNSVSLSHSPFEIRMELFLETPNDESNEIQKKSVADIRISPQFAKQMSLLLTQIVASYEENYGEIKLPIDQTK